MSNRKVLKKIIVFILALAIISAFAVISFASESFEECVAGIDKTANYGTRLERVERAEALYEELSEEKKAEVSELYSVLVAEREEVDALASAASLFITHINGLSDLSDLDDKLDAVNTARREDVIFTDESYPGITEALAKLEAFEKSVLKTAELCDAFIEAVDRAMFTDPDDYIALSEALGEARACLSGLDKSYDGVEGAYADYGALSSALRVKEEYTEEFLRAVDDMKTISEYKSFSRAYNSAKDYMKNEKFIPEYEGVAEAILYLAEAEEVMKDAVRRANAFITFVNTMGSDGDIFEDLVESYAYLRDVDLTVDGAAAAKETLDRAIEDYNKRVTQMNADFSYV